MSDTTDTGEDLQQLAATLDGVVLGVPGVVGLIAAQPTVLRAAKETVGVLLGTPVQSARVSVRRPRGSVVVEANIAVDSDQAAPAVAQAVHRAIVDALPRPDAEDAEGRAITVRVVDVVPSAAH
ncbi:MAG TPA: hypothetical protein VNJ54_01715 [Plantibacter sp.]|uniref:hypothetical protein n=1 Tax=unclassified Plantibacter TaxID=2624265 RepID=UPI002C1421A4|nr:hypothetical protein [Plantibacter sp.]